MARAILGIVLLALAVVPMAAQAETCRKIDFQGGSLQEGDCPSEGGGNANQNPWTGDTAQVVYAALGGAGSIGSGLFFVARRRKRRGELRAFMADVEATFAAAKSAPDEGLPKLDSLRRGLQASHDAGRIEDAQFLELDKRLADYITRIRMVEVERWFPHLPISLVSEIRTVISDGHFSVSDLSLVEKRAVQLDVPAHVRKDLAGHLAQWVKGDRTVQPVTPANPPFTARKIAVIVRK